MFARKELDTIISGSVVALLLALIWKLRYDSVSPVVLFIAANFAVMLGGYYLRPDSDLFDLIGRTGKQAYPEVYAKCGLFLLAFGTGAICSRLRQLATAERAASQVPVSEAALAFVPVLGLACVVAYVLGTGPSELFQRSTYMTESVAVLKQLGGLGALLCCFFLGSHSALPGSVRVSGIAVFLLIEVCFMGYSSRSSAFGLVLFFAGRIYAVQSRRNSALMLVAMTLAPLLVHVSLYMRSSPHQGLIPLGEALFGGKGLFTDFSYSAALNNFLFVNFYITSLTDQLAQVDLHHMLISLNPLPGGMVGWADEPSGIHPFIPYTAFGEWASFSAAGGALFYGLLGVAFGWLDGRRVNGRIVYLYVVPAFLTGYTVLSLQYTTRAATRILYYLAAILIAEYLCRLLLRFWRQRAIDAAHLDGGRSFETTWAGSTPDPNSRSFPASR